MYLSLESLCSSAALAVSVGGTNVFVGGIAVSVGWNSQLYLLGGKDSSSMTVASTSPVHGPAPPS